MKFRKNTLFIFVFASILGLPMMGQFSGMSDWVLKSSEKRRLAPFPDWAKEGTKDYMRKLDVWYKDHFGFRNVLMRSYSKLKYSGLKVSPLPDRMIQGKAGWLYNIDNRAIKAATEGPAYNKEELDVLLTFFEEKQAWLSERNIRFYIAIAPGKFTACKKNLPAYLQKQEAMTPISQLENRFQLHHDLPFFNLQKGFPQEEDGCMFFRKTDIHWNNLGAYWASTYLLDKIKKDFPEIVLPQLSEFKQVREEAQNGDQGALLNLPIHEELIKLKHKGKPGYTLGKKKRTVPENYRFHPNIYEHRFLSNRPEKTGLKVMVYHDSYGLPFQKFLSKSFDEVVFFRIEKFMDEWSEELILQEAPDILIFLSTGQNINKFI
jgi:hypothetical protein